MPQTIRRGGGADWKQREIHPGVAVLASVVVLVLVLFLVHQFITPIFPRKQVPPPEAMQTKMQELQQRMPQGGWVSPAPGMPPMYVPPAGQTASPPQGR